MRCFNSTTSPQIRDCFPLSSARSGVIGDPTIIGKRQCRGRATDAGIGQSYGMLAGIIRWRA